MVSIERTKAGSRLGVRAIFSDNGPGIGDLDSAMRDGFSTAGSLGLGLPGSRRLVDEFSIDTALGRGTTVVIAHWNR
jgi:serine/threonine-protein kinase RsbT